MKRRSFIAGLAGVAAWPVVARAQQADRVRRIAVLVGYAEDDPNVQVWLPAFRQGLEKLGWSEDRNIRIDYRFAPNSGGRVQELAKGLVVLRPDAILTTNSPVTAAVHEKTNTIPIVFVAVSDPVGSGFIASLARPGANVTGFLSQCSFRVIQSDGSSLQVLGARQRGRSRPARSRLTACGASACL